MLAWLSVWSEVADLHTAQLMPLPLTVSCFSKIQIGFTFLVPADPGSPGQRAVKQVCVRYQMPYNKQAADRDGAVTSGSNCKPIN